LGVLSKAAWIFGVIFLLFGTVYLVSALTRADGDIVLHIVTGIFAMFIGVLLCNADSIAKDKTEYREENISANTSPASTNSSKTLDNNLGNRPLSNTDRYIIQGNW